MDVEGGRVKAHCTHQRHPPRDHFDPLHNTAPYRPAFIKRMRGEPHGMLHRRSDKGAGDVQRPLEADTVSPEQLGPDGPSETGREAEEDGAGRP